jgi:hypothetical protein
MLGLYALFADCASGLAALLAGAVEFDAAPGICHWAGHAGLRRPDGSASIAQVMPGFASRFRRTPRRAQCRLLASVFWLKVDLHYAARHRAPRHLAAGAGLPAAGPPRPLLAGQRGDYRLAQRTGDALPFASREIRQNNYLFELPFNRASDHRLPAPAQPGFDPGAADAVVRQAYLEDQPVRLYVLGMIYGVLLGMLVYNLFIYLSVRDTSYLYYILYIASFGLYQVSVNGAAVAYFWPDSPWWANAATPCSSARGLFGCQFARTSCRRATQPLARPPAEALMRAARWSWCCR